MLMSNPTNENIEEISLNKFVEEVKAGIVHHVVLADNTIQIELADGKKQTSQKEPGADIYSILEKTGVKEDTIATLSVTIEDTAGDKFWIDLLISFLPFIFIIGFFLFMMRSAQNSNNQAMGFGKSKAKIVDKEKEKTNFNNVAGVKEAKAELEEIVDFLKKPQKYTSMGAKIPKGVLLIGPPGTGKTLLARAVAGEAEVPFFTISGSEFVEMFVGVGASRVRDLFKKAKRNSPCIIFIDEIDAVGRHRGAGMGGGHDEREQTLNQILSEMDGFETGTNVIVMAATNRPDVLDPALLRPGRFDRRVVVDVPDLEARKEILEVHSRNKPISKSVDLGKIARQTPGFTGADLENLLNESAILAAKQNKKNIGNHDIEESVEKVLMGPERKSRVLSKDEKRITAFHEVGHAVVGQMLPGCDKVRKISIISRGMSLGSTWFIPSEDKHLHSKQKFEDEICSLLGGYVAEEITFGQVTTGASNDLERATTLARRMVTEFGMSDLGPVIFGEKNKEVFLGKDFGHVRNYSEEVASEIDKQIKRFIDRAHKHTETIIAKNKKLIEEIAEDLIRKETITEAEFAKYFEKHKVPKKLSV
ncbi:ATP-dependent zinc metalloprotease FtsH [Candidatus Peregrinibacteria bacterium]|nr:ATP-dependent zinc metalloprotease FtsH [Candidatus Peregrinibacteria bacterium]MBT4055969.1 ATP-dependent zinc metalloprotease FtsH [Candidatus Peregrinibacteria bacterium]